MINYPLASSTWDDKELEAIQSVIKNDIYSMNGNVAQFEQDFAKFINRKYCVMTSSGSSANLIAVGCQSVTTVQPEIIQDRRLLKIIDILGRETKPTINTSLFYIYDDGTVEKKLIIE